MSHLTYRLPLLSHQGLQRRFPQYFLTPTLTWFLVFEAPEISTRLCQYVCWASSVTRRDALSSDRTVRQETGRPTLFVCIKPMDKICPKRKDVSNTSHYSDSHEERSFFIVWNFFFVKALAFLQINLCYIWFIPGNVKQFIFGFIVSDENNLRKKELLSEGQTQL